MAPTAINFTHHMTMAINWNSFSGDWSICDQEGHAYAFSLYETKPEYLAHDDPEVTALWKYLDHLERNHPSFRWRGLPDLWRGGDDKKTTFKAMLNKLFHMADCHGIGLALFALYSGNDHAEIQSQDQLEAYYMRRGFTPVIHDGFKLLVRRPNTLQCIA